MLSHVFALALAASATLASPVVHVEARQTNDVIAGHAAGTLGPAQGTAGGAINGATGFLNGCIGGGYGQNGETACFPIQPTPAPNTASAANNGFGGNVAGTLGPLSGFASAPGYCAGGAFVSEGFTYCLQHAAQATAPPKML